MKLVIQQKEGEKDSPKKKTRQFSALCLGYINLPFLWESGYHKTETRPAYITVAGTAASLPPFLANFHKKGLRADLQPDGGRASWNKNRNWFRCLKSANYALALQRDGADRQIGTLYQPSLFQVDPGMIDPKVVRFVSLPPQNWCEAEARALSHNDKTAVIQHAHRLSLLSGQETLFGFVTPFTSEDDLLALIPQAVHFGHCLDKRIKRPLIASFPFYFHLYLAALADGIASYWQRHSWEWATHGWASDFVQSKALELGFAAGAVVNCTHQEIDTFLEKEVARYLALSSSK